MAVKIGFIGTGGIAKAHLKSLATINDAEVVSLCDIDEDKVKAAAKERKCSAYTDYNRMLGEEELDAVYICVPPFAHGAPEEACIEKGLHMFVEKPVHVDTAKAEEIADKIKDAGLITAVGYQDRYLDIIARVKELLRDRKPGMVMGYWMGGMPGVAWWRVKEQSGGQAVEQTTHIFDMARYLFGEVDTVYAQGTTGLMTDVENYDIEDASAVTLRFKSGLVAVIFSACFLKIGNRSGLDIYCKDMMIEYKERASIKVLSPGKEPEEMKASNSYQVEVDRAFVEAVKTGDQGLVRSSYEDAVRSLALSTAANESMKTGQAIRL